MKSFLFRASDLLINAQLKSEFLLSRAEKEAALQPLVDELIKDMPQEQAVAYIRASGPDAGSPAAIALAMYKR